MIKRLGVIFIALLMIFSFVAFPTASAMGAKTASPSSSTAAQEAVSLNITCNNEIINGTYYVKVGLFKNYKAMTIQLGYTTSLTPENIAKVEWSSSNKHITIDKTGKCKPTVNGKCSSNITVKITDTNGKTYSQTILMKLYKFSWDKNKKNY